MLIDAPSYEYKSDTDSQTTEKLKGKEQENKQKLTDFFKNL